MIEEPTYLPLLNAIVARESSGAVVFSAWATHTSTPEVRAMLRTVALREEEHAVAFRKRIDELGFAPEAHHDPALAERVAIASSAELGDRARFERLGFGAPRPDAFTSMFDDTSIDIATGALLGRYIAEERDSARLIDDCYARLIR